MKQLSRLVKALFRKPVDRTPVWIMRQAGRYLPEYRQVRKQAGDFLTLCKTPELACQVTLQPLERYPLDAAIIFSDILTIPDAYHLGLRFVEGEGPVFEKPIQTVKDIETLPTIDPTIELGYVMEAIRLVKKNLSKEIPLIGFAGSPWTMACYMVQGGSSKTFSQIKKWRYQNPQMLHRLLDHLRQSVEAYLAAQIEAGADVVMIFDTWGGLLSYGDYEIFSLKYMREITQTLQSKYPNIPTILFTKNAGQWLEIMADTGCQALGIDWTISLSEAKKRVGDKVALQGNLDPSVLYAEPEIIYQETRKVLKAFGQGPGHIFNLGHGISPDVNPEHVSAMIEAVQSISVEERV